MCTPFLLVLPHCMWQQELAMERTLLCILALVNSVTSSTYYIREDGCDHAESSCTSPFTNYTERCLTNSDGFGLSPVECSCCEDTHSCNDDYDNRRRLLSANSDSFSVPLTSLVAKFSLIMTFRCCSLQKMQTLSILLAGHRIRIQCRDAQKDCLCPGTIRLHADRP